MTSLDDVTTRVMRALPGHPAVTGAIDTIRRMARNIPETTGDDTYIAVLEMDDIATRLYRSGEVAAMNEVDRGMVLDVRRAVNEVKNDAFDRLGLPREPGIL